MDRYHALADATMTCLLERLEDLLDEISNEAFEVDYHVSRGMTTSACELVETHGREARRHNSLMDIILEWRINTQPWFKWDIRDQ